MKIRALRPQRGNYGFVDKNGTIDVAENKAREMIRIGRWVPAEYQQKKAQEPENKKAPEAANKASARPSGGPTGEAKPSSSSQEAPARKKRVSKKSKAAAE